MPRIIVYPYKIGSQSARLLATGLNALRVRVDGRYRPRATDFIINWGNGKIPVWWPMTDRGFDSPRILNMPTNVAGAANKLHTFRILQRAGVATPEWTDRREVARDWHGRVYARHSLTGHSGEGIDLIYPDNYEIDIPAAPLYTKEIANDGEYRVHVFGETVIDYTKKRRRHGDRPTPNQDAIRNLDNGWVYTRQNLRRLERIEQLAIAAVRALGLDFGAVDIIKNERGEVFVLEVNTACGLGDTTLDNYLNAFRNVINNA